MVSDTLASNMTTKASQTAHEATQLEVLTEEQAWRKYSRRLADWVNEHLINRDDTYGSYTGGGPRTAKQTLDREGLIRHFRGKEIDDLVGLHTTSRDGECGWIAIDVDHHAEPDQKKRRLNEKAALKIYAELKQLGFSRLLVDSNGKGGYHVWCFFFTPVKAESAWKFAQWLLRDWPKHLPRPETFPKQATLPEKGYGNWLRLPGRHHTLEFFTRVWSGKKWLAGEAAIKQILKRKPRDVEFPKEALTWSDAPSIDSSPASKSNVPDHLARVLKKLGVPSADFREKNTVTCPAHDDKSPSLGVWLKADGNVGIKCHAGCQRKQVLNAMGLELADLKAPPPTESQHAPKQILQLMTSAEFARAKYQHGWLVKNLLVEGQPAVIGGPSKSLKTSIAIDLAISLASGTPVLGHFDVPTIRRVGVISGESGPATIRETANRICRGRNLELEELKKIWWGHESPKLSDAKTLDALDAALRRHKLDVVIIDPLYLCLLAGGSANPANIYDMGPLLLSIADRCLEAGSTPILVHHTKKSAKDTRPAELNDLAFAGISEFARQWIMLSSRAPFDSEEHIHVLNLNAGGSAWGGTRKIVEIDEGSIGEDFEGRTWRTRVMAEADWTEQKKVYSEEKRIKQRQLDEILILDKLRDSPDTESGLQKKSKLSKERVKKVIQELLADKQIEPCKVQKPGGKAEKRDYEGYRLVE